MADTRLTSPANPRIKRAMKLRKSRDRRKLGVFLAEGRREVTRAVAAGLEVRELFIAPELLDAPPPAVAAKTFEVPATLLAKMTYRDDPEGLLAVVADPGWSLGRDLPPAGAGGVVLVAVGTAKPGNLGAMVRTAAAAGCGAVIAAGAYVDAFNPNAIRASTGAVFALPTIAAAERDALQALRGRGWRVVATSPDAEQMHTEADLTGPVSIVIGPEDSGLDAGWLDAADTVVKVPMRAGVVDSLNASTAAAVLLFEAVRQRAHRL